MIALLKIEFISSDHFLDSYCRKERSIKEIIEKYFIFAELWPFEFEKVEKMAFSFKKSYLREIEVIVNNFFYIMFLIRLAIQKVVTQRKST